MSPEELAEIEARLRAATPGPWRYNKSKCYRPGTNGAQAVVTDQEAVFVSADGPTIALTGNVDDPQSMADADFIAHAPTDIAALLAEVRRLTPAPRIAVWEAGVDDYEGCAVLRDPATGAVLGWYNQADWGGCIWAEGEFPGAKRKVTKHAAKNGWEVRDA